ncbi:MAG TPA: shikimate dehydrogenase (NADP+), partial [Anaeromyxobacteraceae bacterium]
MITGRTHLYAVIGQPIAHSRSPELQNAAFAAVGIDAAYLALPVAPERLPEALRGAHALGFRGLNVTVPHKQAAAEQCLELDETARLCGAANTLARLEGGWRGANTDAPACRDLLRAAGLGAGARGLLLG